MFIFWANGEYIPHHKHFPSPGISGQPLQTRPKPIGGNDTLIFQPPPNLSKPCRNNGKAIFSLPRPPQKNSFSQENSKGLLLSDNINKCIITNLYD